MTEPATIAANFSRTIEMQNEHDFRTCAHAAREAVDNALENLNFYRSAKHLGPVTLLIPEEQLQSGGETCRYTGQPLEGCNCTDGCETNKVEAGEWIQPVREGYKMACCDCGLVHSMNFRLLEGNIQFQAFREN